MASVSTSHDSLEQLIAAAARFLPPQGPIDAFVAQNPLQGFEGMPFEEAVVRAARLYRAQPFLPETAYREEMNRQRVRVSDIEAVLDSDLGEHGRAPLAGGRTTLAHLRRQLLLHGVSVESDAAVRWTLTESHAIERLRDDLEPHVRARLLAAAAAEDVGQSNLDARIASDLWHACVEVTSGTRPAALPPPSSPTPNAIVRDDRSSTRKSLQIA